jgi:choline dehydrogenase-like flavoprotein
MPDERQVVVIGSGPAGAAAARELVQSGIPVTMLESGLEFEHGLLLRLGGKNLYRKMPPKAGTSFPEIRKHSSGSSLPPEGSPITGQAQSHVLPRRILPKAKDCTSDSSGPSPIRTLSPTTKGWSDTSR